MSTPHSASTVWRRVSIYPILVVSSMWPSATRAAAQVPLGPDPRTQALDVGFLQAAGSRSLEVACERGGLEDKGTLRGVQRGRIKEGEEGEKAGRRRRMRERGMEKREVHTSVVAGVMGTQRNP